MLKEGFVTAGDSISRIEVGAPGGVTISEFTKLYRDYEALYGFLVIRRGKRHRLSF